MKTRTLNAAGAALLFAMAIAVLLILSRNSNQAMMSIPIPFIFEGEYSRDGMNWMPLESDSDISALDGDLYLRGNFDPDLAGDADLNFYLDHISIQSICVNGEEIFGETSLESEAAGRDMCGELWYACFLPEIQKKDIVEIHLHNPHSFGNGNAYREFLESLYGKPQEFFKDWLGKYTFPFWAAGTIILIISLILTGISLGLLVMRIPAGETLLYIGLFDMLMGAYILLDTADISLKSNLIVFNTYARRFCIMLAGVELGFCILKGLTGKAEKAAGMAVFSLLMVSGVLLIPVIAGKMLLYDTVPYHMAAQAIACIVLFFSCFCEIFKGKKENYFSMVAFLAVLLAAFLEMLNTCMYWWQGAILFKAVFLLFFVFQLVRVVLYILAGCRAGVDAERLAKELRDSRIMLAMSQIRTHFIFNVLNAISGMCKYDPEKADETVVRFSRYLRSNMNVFREDKPIPFLKELEHLEDYVALEQVRFGDQIIFREDIEVKNFMIPTFVLQPVVENSIKHGLLPKASGGVIELRTRKEGRNIIISISDDGVGYDMNGVRKEDSIGLDNVLFRLQNIINGTMTIQSKPGEGTTVTITIPYLV